VHAGFDRAEHIRIAGQGVRGSTICSPYTG
jgi:hypothetical protein